MKTIRIKDYYGKYIEVDVTDDFAEEWRLLENESQRIYRKETYHRSGVPIDALDDYLSIDNVNAALERLMAQDESDELYAAIERLTPTQRRRVRMYMNNMSYRDIAKEDHAHLSSVQDSLTYAFKNLRRILSE